MVIEALLLVTVTEILLLVLVENDISAEKQKTKIAKILQNHDLNLLQEAEGHGVSNRIEKILDLNQEMEVIGIKVGEIKKKLEDSTKTQEMIEVRKDLQEAMRNSRKVMKKGKTNLMRKDFSERNKK